MYFALFHGRLDPTADLDDWGLDGPVFEVVCVHGTYWCDLKVDFADGQNVRITPIEDLIYYDGIYYGDWQLHTDTDHTRQVVKWDHKKAEPLPYKPRERKERWR